MSKDPTEFTVEEVTEAPDCTDGGKTIVRLARAGDYTDDKGEPEVGDTLILVKKEEA